MAVTVFLRFEKIGVADVSRVLKRDVEQPTAGLAGVALGFIRLKSISACCSRS